MPPSDEPITTYSVPVVVWSAAGVPKLEPFSEAFHTPCRHHASCLLAVVTWNSNENYNNKTACRNNGGVLVNALVGDVVTIPFDRADGGSFGSGSA